MKNNNFQQQTHFLGVLIPEELTLILEDCRRYMNEAYGCKSGYGTPIHVTLIPPFRLPEEYGTEDLAAVIEGGLLANNGAESLKFTAHIDNFDAFGDRTIFAKVLSDEKWTCLRDRVFCAIQRVMSGVIKKDQRPFQPHLTVANRDIPSGVSTNALEVMNELQLREDFPVDNITIFERHGGKWIAAWQGEII